MKDSIFIVKIVGSGQSAVGSVFRPIFIPGGGVGSATPQIPPAPLFKGEDRSNIAYAE